MKPNRGGKPTAFTRAAELSIVVPAFNEAAGIGETLDAIRGVLGTRWRYEMLVVDHGSTDGTRRVAREHGAAVLVRVGGTIGGLRNHGVRRARGEVLVFLDADVSITTAWAARLPAALERLRARPLTITGSLCTVPARSSWIERHWFAPRLPRATHVGTGHMLVMRRDFTELGGFDESLATGEDYEFCARARARGGEVVVDPELVAVHRGFPRTLRSFIAREAWHGAGDATSLGTVLCSRVAQLTLGWLALHALAVGAAALGRAGAALLASAGILGICLASSAAKYGVRSPARTLATTALYYFYFAGRALAWAGRGRSRVRAAGRRRGAARAVATGKPA
jgi:hypothetical protein